MVAAAAAAAAVVAVVVAVRAVQHRSVRSGIQMCCACVICYMQCDEHSNMPVAAAAVLHHTTVVVIRTYTCQLCSIHDALVG
jgi:phosphoribosylcarboxyaminoimidazole (NCAIR) mutase